MIRTPTLACVALLAASAAADAGVLVAPTRLVFEGKARSGHFVLLNTGDAVERYRISLVDRRMNQQGRIEPAEELGPDERSARAMLRFSPRQVELRPGEPQTVRVLVRKPGGLEKGEYRVHLQVQQIPPPPAAPAPDAGPRSLGVRLQPIFGVTVPVIVRHGSLDATARLDALALGPPADDGRRPLRFEIHRDGERSTYGGVIVDWLPADGREPVELGRTNGVAVYTPNRMRPFTQMLAFPNGVVPSHGRLKLRYLGPENAGSTLLAEAGLDLPAP